MSEILDNVYIKHLLPGDLCYNPSGGWFMIIKIDECFGSKMMLQTLGKSLTIFRDGKIDTIQCFNHEGAKIVIRHENLISHLETLC